MRLAAIDIGSNAARLLICQVIKTKQKELHFIKLNLVRVPLRLGFDVFENGYISFLKENELVNTLQVYQKLMDFYNVDYFEICATSAMRDASNAAEVISRVHTLMEMQIKVVSGKEEAAMIFENHIEEYLDKDHAYLYIDVGGGSTELTLFDNYHPVFEESFDIGTVRILKNKVKDKEWQRFKSFVKLEGKKYKNLMGIGSGGNINKISSISKVKQGSPISFKMLNDYKSRLEPLSVEERMILYDLREDRADVIIPALEIYTSIMRWADIKSIYVPKFGLVDGLIRNLYHRIDS